LHLKAPAGTPLANVMLSLLHALGVEVLGLFGDSTGGSTLRGERRQLPGERRRTIRQGGGLEAG